jgi:hypothetical protein
MLSEAERAPDERQKKEQHRHVGDFALFWTGVFPEALGASVDKTGSLPMADMQRQGKHAYLLASTLSGDDDAPVLRRLSAEFELCAFGLSRVREGWQRMDPPGSWGPRLVIA